MTKMLAPLGSRAVAALITALAAVLSQAAASAAATYTPDNRGAHSPNVMMPFTPRGYVDQRTFKARTASTRGHDGTEFNTTCGRPVYATHPGVVEVTTNYAWAGPNLVKVTANTDGIRTQFAYMASTTVKTGQIVTSGQQIGTVGNLGRAKGCQLRVIVHDNLEAWVNPTSWLGTNVGHPLPGGRLLNHGGFTLVSFNVLGASHTRNSAKYAPAAERVGPVVDKWSAMKADVIGVQEMQREQRAAFYSRMKSSYTFFPFDGGVDTDNSILWRQATFGFVQGGTFKVPYFSGNLRNMPWVLLREKATGKTAYFINVHNPATLPDRGDQSQWRAAAIAAERALVTKLKATGVPVFLTGDFNDKEKAVCPLTGDGLMVSASGGGGTPCVLPYQIGIDWIFGAGNMAFSTYIKDKSTQEMLLSDHPMIIARTHLGSTN